MTLHQRIGPSRPRRGGSLVYAGFACAALAILASLGLDWGHVVMAKAELDRGVTAAARYAVTGVSDGTALSKANSLSGNAVDGTPLVFAASDVETGTWDDTAGAFAPGGNSPNAVRVTGRRTAATGNAVPLSFARLVGKSSCDVVVTAVVKINSTGYGVIGLNFVKMVGNTSDSYWSAGGPAAPNAGSVASNGNITLTGNSSIHGDAHPGPGYAVIGSNVSGSTTPLRSPLVFPDGDAGPYASVNDNANFPAYAVSGPSFVLSGNQSATLPGGNYYVKDFSVGSNNTVTFTGPATVYCYGNFSMSGHAVTSSNLPGNLKIVLCPGPDGAAPGSLTLAGSTALYADIYAPQSNITVVGTGDIYGSVLGLSVSMTGTANIHYDLNLKAKNGAIQMVK